ncbi:MAG: hypothetical protein WDO70_06980 [Alphaproteobacteria bacterium]
MKINKLGILPLLLLAACASDDSAKPDRQCPQIAAVRDLAQIADFGREEPRRSELVAAAKIDRVDGDCKFSDGGGIDVVLDAKMLAERGPKLGVDRVEFPYFVALVTPADIPVRKQNVAVVFKFSGDDRRADSTEKLHVTIPNADDGKGWRVLVGFQLTPEQLAFNRGEPAAAPSQGMTPPKLNKRR